MKSIKWFMVAALAACGGNVETEPGFVDMYGPEPEIEQPDEAEQVPETDPSNAVVQLGTAEQAITVAVGYGFNNGSNGQNYRCQQFTGLETDKCIYPADVTRKFCVLNVGMTAAQKAEAEADVDSILGIMDSQFPAWSFSRSCVTPDVNIEYGNIPASQVTTSIMGYVQVTAINPTLLAEVITGPLKGSHFQQNANPIAVRVDRPQIVADFAVADQQRVRRHALFGAMYVAGVGLGFTPDHINRVTSITTTPGTAKSTSVSTPEQCRVNNFLFPTVGGQISIVNAGC